MSKRRKRYWFHLTEDDRGDSFYSERKAHFTEGEPDTPRLCVAPSVISCFIARLFLSKVYVYRTNRKLKCFYPGKRVHDAAITQEHWVFERVLLERVKVIEEEIVQRINRRMIYWFTDHGSLNLHQRVLYYRYVANHMLQMEPDAPDHLYLSKRLCNFVKRKLSIPDRGFEEYLSSEDVMQYDFVVRFEESFRS